MALPSGHQESKKEFWRRHIAAAESFDGSFREYCSLHNLNPSSMNSYRRRLGYSKPRKKSSEFAAISISSTAPSKTRDLGLPDPEWLAQFLKAWSQK